jgi:AraC family transcriptional activator of tynA and feaB
MGTHPEEPGRLAHDGQTGPAVSGGRLSRRDRAELQSSLIIQVFRQESGAHGVAAADVGWFLVLVEAEASEKMASGARVPIAAAALAERCPRWRQFAFRPIAADEGLGAVVRNHLTTLAAQAANIDPSAVATMAAMTAGLVAALLNSLDSRLAEAPVTLPTFHRRRIKEFVLDNLCDPALDIDMVSAAVGLSPRYIHQLFASEPTSLMQWIITKRLIHCHHQLVDHKRRNWKISQIAFDAGFNDLAHFSRSFRKHFNLSPSQARSAAY